MNRLGQRIACYKTPLLLALIVMFGLALRVYQIDRESFWIDEAASYWRARTSPTEMIKETAKNVQAPFYYLTLHYWIKWVGDSDGAIRFLSALFGILAIPAVFQIGKLLFHERYGLVAALFLAVSGFHIQYSQEARPYALYFLLTSLSVLFAILAYKRTRYGWVGYIISSMLLLYTHDTAVFAVPAIVLFYLLLSWPWRRLSSILPFLLSTAVVFLLYSPWIPVYARQAIRVKEDFWTSGLTVRAVLETARTLIFFLPLANIPSTIQYALLAVPFSILTFSLLALWARKKALIGLVLFFLIPVGINLIVSITIRNIFILKVLIPALLPLLLLWGTPILIEKGGLSPLCRKLALLAMASMLLLSLVGSIEFLRHNSKEPWRQAAEIFQKSYKPGDGVVYLLAFNERAFLRYLPSDFYDVSTVAIPTNWRRWWRGSLSGTAWIPPKLPSAHSFWKVGSRRAQPLYDTTDKTGIAALRRLKSKNIRLWLVLHPSQPDRRYQSLTTSTLAWLDENYKNSMEWHGRNLALILYEPR